MDWVLSCSYIILCLRREVGDELLVVENESSCFEIGHDGLDKQVLTMVESDRLVLEDCAEVTALRLELNHV